MLKRLSLLAVVIAACASTAQANLIYGARLKVEHPPTKPAPTYGYLDISIQEDNFALQVLGGQFFGLTGETTGAGFYGLTASPNTGTAEMINAPPTLGGFPLGVHEGFITFSMSLNSIATYNPDFVAAHGGTAAGARDAFLAGLADSTVYFQINTTTHPDGEIRGFFRPTPEPSSLALAGVGAVLFVGMARRQRARRGLTGCIQESARS